MRRIPASDVIKSRSLSGVGFWACRLCSEPGPGYPEHMSGKHHLQLWMKTKEDDTYFLYKPRVIR